MPTPLVANAVLATTGLKDSAGTSPPALLTDLDEPSGSPDALTWEADALPFSARLGLENPGAALAGTQTFRVALKRGSDPYDARVSLYQNGALVRLLLTTTITSPTGQEIVATWDAAEITQANDVEILIEGLASYSVDTADTTTISKLWGGAASGGSFTAAGKLPSSSSDARLIVATSSDMVTGRIGSAPIASNGQYVIGTVTGLQPDTQYFWAWAIGTTIYGNAACRGSFRTHPTPGARSFRFTAASCCDDGPNSAAWTAMGNLDPLPLFMQHLGDFHYGNDALDSLMDAAIAQACQGLMLKVPVLWIWSDHDFLANGSHSTTVSSTGKVRADALALFRRRMPIPHAWYWDTAAGAAVGYSYIVGRVRFLVPDQRADRIGATTQLWSAAQRARFFQEITDAKAAGQVVIYVSDVPPAGTEYAPSDRTLLWDHVYAEGMQNSFLILCGDAHSCAADNGAYHDFATGGGGLPVFLASPLHNGWSHKGDRYNLFTPTPGPNSGSANVTQFGIFDVTDTGGDLITIAYTAWDATGNVQAGATSLDLWVPGYTPPAAGPMPTYVRSTPSPEHSSTGAVRTALATTPQAGNTLVMCVSVDKACGVATPSGWTAFPLEHRLGNMAASVDGISGALFWKLSDGTETSTAVTVTDPTTTSNILVMEFAGAGASPIGLKATSGREEQISTARTASLKIGRTQRANELAVAIWTNDSYSSTDMATAPTWTGGFAPVYSWGMGEVPTPTPLSSGTPAFVAATLAAPAAGTALATSFTYSGDALDQNILFAFTVRP